MSFPCKFRGKSFVQRNFPLFLQPVYEQARMAELVDALDSKSSDSNIVPVRFRLRVQKRNPLIFSGFRFFWQLGSIRLLLLYTYCFNFIYSFLGGARIVFRGIFAGRFIAARRVVVLCFGFCASRFHIRLCFVIIISFF